MRFRALALLPVILLTQLLLAQDAKLTAGKREQLEAAISKFMAANSIPGLSAAVVENGEYAWSGGFGMADMENSVPVTARTLFRLGSVSKPLTAVAAMRLWEQGKVDLDAEIQKHCPAFPKKDAPITTRQLLGHLAGVRHYRPQANDPEIMNTTHFSNPIQDGLKMFAPDPLVSMPGTKYNYSTHGYTVIGCAIEGASGATYVDWVRNALLLPAKMIHTQVDDQYAIIPLRTRFYQKKSGTVVNADFLDSSYKIPGGGWLSSAEDLARFEVALLNDTVVKRSTRELMWTALKPTEGTSNYGLGWTIRPNHEVGHGGSQQGASTYIGLSPDKGAGVVVLINMDGVNAGSLALELLKIVEAPGTK